MFFVGAGNLLLAMAWWAAWLGALRWPFAQMHQPWPYAGWLHAFIMQYQMLPSFIFGFLLTTFPKWMGQPEFERWRYAPVGVGLFGGQIATLLGAVGWDAGIVVGLFMTMGGWLAGLLTLGPLLWREKGTTWHARSCFAALSLGFLGLLAWLAHVLGASPFWAFVSIKIGTFGVLLPVYLTVAHRMFPFFAANVVPGYQAWRPLWLLAALWRLRGTDVTEKTEKIALAVILAVGALVRLYFGATQPGYEVDINCFTGWGQMVANVGPAHFYEQGFCDYPPGYLYVLGLEGLTAGLLNLNTGSAGYLLLIKFVPMACDLGIACMLYKLGRKCGKATWALVAAAAYALMPAAILDSAAWGQMDSVLTLLMLLVIDAFMQKKHNIAAILYGVALMVKPQALMLGTIMLGGYVLAILENPKAGFKKLFIGIGLCLIVAAVIAVPFLVRHPIGFIFEKYFSTLSSYPYATVNALNLFYALGGNWVAQETALLGLSYAAWGTIGMLLSVALALVMMFRGRDMRAVVLATALMLAGIFCLGVRMHERYMYPALALLVLAALLYGDKRLWQVFAGYSVTNAVNIYIVLQNEHVLAENRSMGIVIAVVNILLLFYLIEVCCDLCFKGRIAPVEDGTRTLLKRQVLGARLPDAASHAPTGRASAG